VKIRILVILVIFAMVATNIFTATGSLNEVNITSINQIKIKNSESSSDKNNQIIDQELIDCNYDQLDQYQETYTNLVAPIYVECRVAQSFIPTYPILTRVELLFNIWNNIDYELKVSISQGLNFNNDDLINITIIPDIIEDTIEWVEIDFPDINVTPGERYFIVCRCDEGRLEPPFFYGWMYNDEYDSYLNGDLWHSLLDNGYIWYRDKRDVDTCFRTYGIPNEPPLQPTIKGITNGNAGENYSYTIEVSDPEGNDVFYLIDWGDNSMEEWIGPYISGEEVIVQHIWDRQGSYEVRVKAKDIYDDESEWSESIFVNMPKHKIITLIILKLFEKHQKFFPLINSLIENLN